MTGRPDPAPPAVGPFAYAGLFLLSLAGLLDEILLTRIFSVATWYHFAFIAISVAMFGMTAGAILVDALGSRAETRTRLRLAQATLAFAASLALCFAVQIRIPFSTEPRALALLGDAALFLLSAVPFCFVGVAVCLALTRFPAQVGRLYAADLAGAAAACPAVVLLLKVMDGPSAMIAAAAVGALGAACFALDARGGAGRAGRRAVPGGGTAGRLIVLSAAVAAALFGLAASAATRARAGSALLRLAAVKGVAEERPLYERWNSFSRIRVRPSPTSNPLGWGLSPAYARRRPVRQLILDIDGGASTVLTEYRGDPEDVEHLRYDVTSLAHYLRPGARVLAIGAGGGRDVLAALVFGQKSVVGVEINEEIVKAVNGRFGDFTGHLDRDPRVRFVSDEARSYVARGRGRFDIIQASLIDTSAATAAGAFVFTENSIYTVEAWGLFLDRLAPRGLLSFSWFYFSERPAEMYRLTSLASAALRRRGAADPGRHIVLVRQKAAARSVGTVLVSRDPFAEEDMATLDAVVRNLRFDLVLSPRGAAEPVFAALASGTSGATVGDDPPLRVDPPTDDAPFFFNMLRLRDAFRPRVAAQGSVSGNQKAVVLLCALLLAVLAATLACLAAPLARAARRPALRGSIRWILFFACIGMAFMLVEISQMQRLIIFLGHPTYGLSVVLFALLLAGGAGSLSTRAVPAGRLREALAARLAALLLALGLFGGLTPLLVRGLAATATPVRILTAIGVLLPIGFFMGTAFPLGMRAAAARYPGMTAWFWAVNGATSVCASVAATAIALSWGISASFWSGVIAYALALAAARRRGD